MTDESIDRPYKCKVDLALPTPIYAQHLKDALSVDGELGNKIVKYFSVVRVSEDEHGVAAASSGEDMRVLRM